MSYEQIACYLSRRLVSEVSTCMITGWKPSSSFRRFERVIEGTDGSD